VNKSASILMDGLAELECEGAAAEAAGSAELLESRPVGGELAAWLIIARAAGLEIAAASDGRAHCWESA